MLLGLGVSSARTCFRAVTTCAFFLGCAIMAQAGCGTALDSGYHQMNIAVGPSLRQAVSFLPTSYRGTDKVPVVFDFHGSNSHPRGQMRRSSWDSVAEREGFIVVAPQGSLLGSMPQTYAWNVPGVTFREGGLDEVAFIKAAIERVKQEYCLDPTRIYASGYSGGGRMLSAYLCAGGDEFAAAGFVNSLRSGLPVETRDGRWVPDATSCTPARPVSIIAFHGAKDEANPYAGGGKPYWQYGFKTALQRWSQLDGCKGKGVSESADGVTFDLYDTCKGGVRIAAYEFAEGNHDWPRPGARANVVAAASGSQAAGLVKVSGTRKPGFDAYIDPATRMWDFFRKADTSDVIATAASPVTKVRADLPCGADAASVTETPEGMTCSNSHQPIDQRRSGLGAKGAL
ncbi:PHB depolymerase family esterase [Rhizobium sp. FY34]|uniref:alpha/beta hydrolase family esterase n=1 Tax=Rhizobium sp. FY34 TaxID=2562309 RepID=UPI001485569B|nr:PHB depolymerase family esterase [Rhizobium sp. FY34]